MREEAGTRSSRSASASALAGAETRRFLLERNEDGTVSVREDKVQSAQAWA